MQIKNVFEEFKIPINKLSYAVQDSTLSSIMIFDEALWITKSKCLCHLLSLFLKFIFNGSPYISDLLDNERWITTKLGKSPKRLAAVENEAAVQGTFSFFISSNYYISN